MPPTPWVGRLDEDMATRKRHSPEQVVRKLAQADRMLGEGKDLADVCRELQVSEQTYYRWRNQFGGLKAHDAKRLKDLERENATLKRLLGRRRVGEGGAERDRPGKLLSPDRRRAAVAHLIRVMGLSERFACRVTGGEQNHPATTTRTHYGGRPRRGAADLTTRVGRRASPTRVPQRLSRRTSRGLDGQPQENPAALACRRAAGAAAAPTQTCGHHDYRPDATGGRPEPGLGGRFPVRRHHRRPTSEDRVHRG